MGSGAAEIQHVTQDASRWPDLNTKIGCLRRHIEGQAADASIQNVPSGLLISQDFSPRSVPNRHPQGALRTKRFLRTSVPTSMLVLADGSDRMKRCEFITLLSGAAAE